jgi:hypothetical protein
VRHCPESKRRVALLVFTFAGLIAHMIFYVAGLLGIFLTPLFLAEKHPNAPIAFPIRWLQAHFSHDTAIFIYALVSLGIAGILTYAMVVVDYLRYDASKKEKESAV